MRRMVSMLALIGALAACGDAFSPSGVAGSYSLIRINGESLPTTRTLLDGTTVTEESGELVLTEERTYLRSLVLTLSNGPTSSTTTISFSGTYTLVEPDTIRLVAPRTGFITGATIDGGRITLTENGLVSVYER